MKKKRVGRINKDNPIADKQGSRYAISGLLCESIGLLLVKKWRVQRWVMVTVQVNRSC